MHFSVFTSHEINLRNDSRENFSGWVDPSCRRWLRPHATICTHSALCWNVLINIFSQLSRLFLHIQVRMTDCLVASPSNWIRWADLRELASCPRMLSAWMSDWHRTRDALPIITRNHLERKLKLIGQEDYVEPNKKCFEIIFLVQCFWRNCSAKLHVLLGWRMNQCKWNESLA